MIKTKSALSDNQMVVRAIKDSFVKLSPKVQAENPVMLLVYISAILTTGKAICEEEVKKYKNKTCQIKNLKLSELLEMIERLENMIINRTCLMEEHIKDYIVKRYNMD